MLARASYRWITVFVAILLLISLPGFFRSWENSYSRYKPSLLINSRKGPVPPAKPIIDFWAKWTKTFDKARPAIEKIEVENIASKDGSDEANGERKPSSSSLGLSDEDIHSLHKAHKIVLTQLRRSDKDLRNATARLFSGKGIVTVAGGQYMPTAIVSIRMLRKTGSKLPVQVYLQSQKEYEPEICESVLPALNAECFVIESYLPKKSPIKVTHYQLKVMAIIFSSFKEVLFLDSDCFALRDPAELLDSEPYKSKGLVTWPDYWINTEDPVFYEIAGLGDLPPGMPARSRESGQLLVNKDPHLPSLILAAYYNVFGPDYYYPIFSQGVDGMGDKETFLAGAVVLSLPHYDVQEHLGTIGYMQSNKEFKGAAMVQYHAGDEYAALQAAAHNSTAPAQKKKPRASFFHANVPKMNLAQLLNLPLLFDPTVKLKNDEMPKGVRIWGPKESNMNSLGRDIEKEVWREMLDSGCELQYVFKDWKEATKVCERGKEHWKEVFEEVPKGLSGIV
ncbi:MAG: hypothetical protein LQ351_004880 [Letrouitia transgressa]|nr:MAG: hypothetical protein LQ351_004880 [Letrouitia transgressa]